MVLSQGYVFNQIFLSQGHLIENWSRTPLSKNFQVPPGGHDSLDMVYDWLGVITSVIGWSKYRLGTPHLNYWVDWPVGIPIFQRPLTVPCTALTAGKLPAVSAVQGDCESVLAEAEGQLCRMLPGKTQQHQGMQTSRLCKSKLGTTAENGERSQTGATKYRAVFLYNTLDVLPKYSPETQHHLHRWQQELGCSVFVSTKSDLDHVITVYDYDCVCSSNPNNTK